MAEHDKAIGVGSKDDKPRLAKRRWLRRLMLLGCVLVVVLVLLIVLAPTLLSTSAGKGFVLGQVNKQVAGTVEVDALSLGWLSGQSLDGVVVRDTDGTIIARIGRIDLPDASLWSLARGRLDLGELRIGQVTGDIVGYEDGTTNLQRALASHSGPSTPKPSTPSTGSARWPDGLSLAVVVRDVDVLYRAQGVEHPIRLTMPETVLTATDPTHLVLKLDAAVSQDQRKGTLKAEATVDQLFDTSGAYQLAAATVHVQGQMNDLPIDLVDTLGQQDGKLVALLGPVLNGEVRADTTTAGGSAWVKADSENLHVNGRFGFDKQRIYKDGDTAAIRLTLTPEAWAAQTTVEGQSSSTLAGPVDVTVELRGLNLPMSDQGLDLANASVDLGFGLGDTHMRIDGVGDVTLASTTGQLKTDKLGDRLTATLASVSGLNGKPGNVNVTVELAGLIGDGQQVNPAGMTARVNGKLTNAPIAAILDELMPGVTHGLATRTLGPAVDATVNLNTAPVANGEGMAGAFDIDVLTMGGEAELNTTLIGAFSYDKQQAHAGLVDGSYVKGVLPPDLLDAWRAAYAGPEQPATPADPKKQVKLAAPAKFRLELTQASADLSSMPEGGYALDPEKIRLIGKLTSPDLKLNQGGQYAATLKGLLVDITNTGLGGETKLAVKADIDYPASTDEDAKAGLIDSDSSVSGLKLVDGSLSFADATYTTRTQIRQAPIDLVDAMFGMEGELIASVGPRALLEANGSYTPSAEGTAGGLDVVLKSRSSSADLKLLIEDNAWGLKSDAPMSFRVNNTLSQVVLKKVNPFLGSAISAKLPIGVTIKQEGFSAPLRDVALKDINATVELELGTLDLRGEGQLKQVLQQLGVDSQSLLNVQFSPVTIKLDSGKLSYNELVMSVEDIRLGFSGQVDLNTKALDLKMSIPGSSLSRISFLKGKVRPDHVIVIPLTGTFDQPKLDIKLLTGEIAKEALRGELGGVADDAIRDKIGDEAGEAVGGLLNEILKGRNPLEPGAQQAEPTQQQDTTDEAQDAPTDEAADQPELTPEEREARRERRRLRRERLEREAAEQEAQDKQNP